MRVANQAKYLEVYAEKTLAVIQFHNFLPLISKIRKIFDAGKSSNLHAGKYDFDFPSPVFATKKTYCLYGCCLL